MEIAKTPKVVIKRHKAKILRNKVKILDEGILLEAGDVQFEEEVEMSENILKLANEVADYNRMQIQVALSTQEKGKEFDITQKHIIQE